MYRLCAISSKEVEVESDVEVTSYCILLYLSWQLHQPNSRLKS